VVATWWCFHISIIPPAWLPYHHYQGTLTAMAIRRQPCRPIKAATDWHYLEQIAARVFFDTYVIKIKLTAFYWRLLNLGSNFEIMLRYFLTVRPAKLALWVWTDRNKFLGVFSVLTPKLTKVLTPRADCSVYTNPIVYPSAYTHRLYSYGNPWGSVYPGIYQATSPRKEILILTFLWSQKYLFHPFNLVTNLFMFIQLLCLWMTLNGFLLISQLLRIII